jgi:hypothetical protein
MRGSSERIAVRVFFAVELCAGIGRLAQARSRLFFADEWAFLVDRSALSRSDLLDDHKRALVNRTDARLTGHPAGAEHCRYL